MVSDGWKVAGRHGMERPIRSAPSVEMQDPIMLNKKTTTTTTRTEASATPSTTNRSVIARRDVTHDQVARRAYEIFKSGSGGSTEDNWFRAERELRARA
jgi:hypothetical protein